MSPAPDAPEFLDGRLLVAMPGISDPRFERAVILICSHTAEHAMGIRLDKPIEEMTLHDLFERLDIDFADDLEDEAILAGGPVQPERGFVLHSEDVMIEEGSLPVSPGVALTATREILTLMAMGHGPRRAVLALGYAGWGEGQLEDELRENVWLTCAADPDLVLDAAFETKWMRALAKLGIRPDHLSSQAGRA
jgi:putative transcriptional regulator